MQHISHLPHHSSQTPASQTSSWCNSSALPCQVSLRTWSTATRWPCFVGNLRGTVCKTKVGETHPVCSGSSKHWIFTWSKIQIKRRGYVCMPVIEVYRNVLIILLSCRNISLPFVSLPRNNKITYQKRQQREYIPNDIYLIMSKNSAVDIIHPRWINYFSFPSCFLCFFFFI